MVDSAQTSGFKAERNQIQFVASGSLEPRRESVNLPAKSTVGFRNHTPPKAPRGGEISRGARTARRRDIGR